MSPDRQLGFMRSFLIQSCFFYSFIKLVSCLKSLENVIVVLVFLI